MFIKLPVSFYLIYYNIYICFICTIYVLVLCTVLRTFMDMALYINNYYYYSTLSSWLVHRCKCSLKHVFFIKHAFPFDSGYNNFAINLLNRPITSCAILGIRCDAALSCFLKVSNIDRLQTCPPHITVRCYVCFMLSQYALLKTFVCFCVFSLPWVIGFLLTY